MENSHEILLGSVIGVYVILLIASVVAHLLGKKDPGNATIQKVKVIAKSWWYIAVPPTVALVMGPLAVLILFFVVSCLGILEFMKHSDLFQKRTPVIVVLLLTTILQYLSIFLGWNTLFYALIPLALLWVLPLVIILKPEVENLPRLMSLMIGALLVSYYLSHVPALMIIHSSLWSSSDQASLAILILIFATEANDVMQFLSGKAFGRKKIIPQLSPNKTEAGFIGGLVGSMLVFSFFGTHFLQITLLQSMAMGLLISISGIFGDLMFSAVKRYYRVKDFSELIPGHGGLLDRLDSLIFTAPVFFHLIRYFKGGGL